MTSTIGMTLAGLVILFGGGLGIWYWLKIKETPKPKSSPKGQIGPKGLSEPIILSPESWGNSAPSSQTPVKTEPTVSPQPQDNEPVAPRTEPVYEPAPQPVQTPVAAVAPAEEPVVPQTPVRNVEPPVVKEEPVAPAPQFPQKPWRVEQPRKAISPLPFEEVMRFEGIQENGVPTHNQLVEEAIRVNFNHPVPGIKLLRELKPLASIDTIRPIRVYALDASTNTWDRPDEVGSYSSVILFIHLVCSEGALTELEIAALMQIKQRLEMTFDGISDDVDPQAMLNRVQKLNTLVQKFGANISVYLRSVRSISVEEFEYVADKLRLKRISSKVYEKVGELVTTADGKRTDHRRGPISLIWLDPETIQVVLMVPLIAPESQPLRTLVVAANAFAGPFEAAVVDAHGIPISGEQMDIVKKEMDKFYAQMRASNLEPGGEDVHQLLA